MSASHHGSESQPNPEQEKVIRRLLDQFEGKAKREYSAGRVGPDDDGDLAMGIAADKSRGIVVIRFGKPVEWIGLGPADVNVLINNLVKQMHALGEVVQVGVGG